MITNNRHATPVTPAICAAILELVGENVTSLSIFRAPREHPLFDGYKAMLVEEIRTYITQQDLAQIELLAASSEDGNIIGFLLFGLVDTGVLECNIYYTAVQKQSRRRGIMSQMMQEVLKIPPLDCPAISRWFRFTSDTVSDLSPQGKRRLSCSLESPRG